MSNYSLDPSQVRVDVFKPSGKWQETLVLSKANYRGCIYESLKNAFSKQYPQTYIGSTLVCLEPYHELSHPVSFVIG